MAALTVGLSQQVTVKPGDTLVVDVGLTYTTPSQISTEVWVSLYIFPGRDYTIKETAILVPGIDKSWEKSIGVPITDTVGLKNRTYDLLVEVPDAGLEVKLDQVIVVTGITEEISILDMIPMLVVVMMMSMMMNIMGEK